jgi:U3 small nucleolar RNA-associated protein MPP10
MTDNIASPVSGFLEFLARPEDSLVALLFGKSISGAETSSETQLLRQVCQTLFTQIEELGKIQQRLISKTSGGELSGLDQLYLGEDGEPVDVETLWGQVDLQNQSLQTLFKQSLKRLTKNVDEVKLLDMGEVMSDDEKQDDETDSEDASENEDDESNDGEDDGDGDDDEAKRIRERMERAMADMDEDEDEDGDDEDGLVSSRTFKQQKDEESLVDPAAEELNDGFFDIQEMEEFADEEEEYLPEEAYGTVKTEETGDELKKSFHQKQRDGDFDADSDDDDEESGDDDADDDDALAFRQTEPSVRRKKYREDDEIDALYGLYNTPDDDDDDDDRVVNMTAADLFGKPNKKYFEKWKSTGKDRKQADNQGFNDDDADSWDGHDFAGEGEDWRDQTDGKKDSDDDDEEDDDKLEDEEQDCDDEKEPAIEGSNKGGDSKPKSKLARQTEEIEQEMLAEKPWQMTGESKSTTRPVNSLLDSTPEFEVATKMAPIITVEHTANIEEVIKRRILAEDWDDVVPRELPDVAWNKKRGELPEVSQEKSKLGLGELYEREYLKKAVGYDVDAVEKETEDEKAKSEMKALFAGLCSRLDALSNYHFAPRPVSDEAEVRTVTKPAIAMEEVLPLHVSNARGVAPEEVYGAKQGRDAVLRGETERDQVCFGLRCCVFHALLFPILTTEIFNNFRRNERDFGMQRNQPVASPDRQSLPTKSLFRDFSLDWASTIHTKSARFGKNCRRLVPKERLQAETGIPIQITVRVERSSSACRTMRKRMMGPVTRSTRWIPLAKNPVHSNYRVCLFEASNLSLILAICSGVIPQHPPISCTLRSFTHNDTKSM